MLECVRTHFTHRRRQTTFSFNRACVCLHACMLLMMMMMRSLTHKHTHTRSANHFDDCDFATSSTTTTRRRRRRRRRFETPIAQAGAPVLQLMRLRCMAFTYDYLKICVHMYAYAHMQTLTIHKYDDLKQCLSGKSAARRRFLFLRSFAVTKFKLKGMRVCVCARVCAAFVCGGAFVNTHTHTFWRDESAFSVKPRRARSPPINQAICIGKPLIGRNVNDRLRLRRLRRV